MCCFRRLTSSALVWRKRLARRHARQQRAPDPARLDARLPGRSWRARCAAAGVSGHLLLALRLQADVLAEDREVVAMVLQLGLAETLPPPQLGQLLDAVPQHLRTVARPRWRCGWTQAARCHRRSCVRWAAPA
jgi:hypothetical protein